MLLHKSLRRLSVANTRLEQLKQQVLWPDLDSQTPKIEIIRSSDDNIHFNLSIEEYLYKQKVSHPRLFLWRNDRTVVIGRHQNPWKECNIQQMEQKAVSLCRRKTGGGAVYHDLNNTCFTFINSANPAVQNVGPLDYKEINNHILIDALARGFAVHAQVSGRNDIVVEDKKISGSAYQIDLGNAQSRIKRLLHHGTMLIDIDLSYLKDYLNPVKAKLVSKGIDSVISRCLNLKQKNTSIDHHSLCQQIENSFIEFYQDSGQVDVIRTEINLEEIGQLEEVKQVYQQLTSQEWLYGKTPQFTNNIENRFDWGTIDIYFDVKKGNLSINIDIIIANIIVLIYVRQNNGWQMLQ